MSGGVVDLANAGFDEDRVDDFPEHTNLREQLANAIAERQSWMRESQMLMAAMIELRDELTDAISGYDEDKARDQQISSWVRMCDAAIAKGTS